MNLNNYIPTGYENHEIFKGLIIPRGNGTFCQSFGCHGLNCDQNCLFGNKKMLELYFKSKERKLKLKKLNESWR